MRVDSPHPRARRRGIASVCVIVAGLVAGSVEAQQAAAGESDAAALSREATDPTASLMALNVVGEWEASYHGDDGSGFSFLFRPVIPYEAWGMANILRITVPYRTSGLGPTGLGSVSIFDLVVFPQSWGRFGVGPVLSFSSRAPGSTDSNVFGIGPAVGAVVNISPRLKIGAFNQNVFGNELAVSQLQPVVAYQLGEGWALSAGDLQLIYDWNGGRFVSVPIGFQIGKVTRVGGQPMRFSVNPQWNLQSIDGTPSASVGFTATLLAPSGG